MNRSPVRRVEGHPLVLELFAGGGGAALGLLWAGFRHVGAVDFNQWAVATLRRAGFPGVLSRVDSYRYHGQRPDLIWASPPCQPFSSMGKREGEHDPRNAWPETIEQIKRIAPAWVVIEDVTSAPIGPWSTSLRAAGYAYVESFTLDAADHLTAQHRVRSFIVAGPRRVREPTKYRHIPAAQAAPSLHGKWLRVGTATARARLADERPSPTITGGYNMKVHAVDVGTRRAGDIDPTDSRKLTFHEAKLLSGFPPNWPFQGPARAQWKQLGNVVTPPQAKAVAEVVKEAMR